MADQRGGGAGRLGGLCAPLFVIKRVRNLSQNAGNGQCYDIDFDIIGFGNPVTPAVGQRAAVELVLLNL